MTAFIKTVLPASFGYDEPTSALVDVHSRGVDSSWMSKRAAAGVFKSADIKSEPGHSIIHLIAMGDSNYYGCFFEGAPVQTLDGQKPIEKVAVGDMALTHTGVYRPVISVFSAGYTGDRVRLAVRGLPNDITCTANHPFRVVRRAGLSGTAQFNLRERGEYETELESRALSAETVRADEIRPGDYVVIKTELDTTGIQPIPAHYDPYVLGFYVAEGCLSKEYEDISTRGEWTGVVLTGSDKDAECFDYVNNWLAGLGRPTVQYQRSFTSDYGLRMTFGFKELAGQLCTWFGYGARDKRLHPAVWCWSVEQRTRFLAGYFDGDGCLHTTDNRYLGTLAASTASRTLALDIQRLLASIGVASSVNQSANRHDSGCFGTEDAPIYSVSVGAYYSNIILRHCKRLAPHARESGRRSPCGMRLAATHALLPVSAVSLDFVEDETKYNIEVDVDHTYVVDCQVHNSNRNGDVFLEKRGYITVPNPRSGVDARILINCGNIETHGTFEKHAKVYRDHINKDPSKSFGDVIKSAHNDDMHRVELLIKVKDDVWRDDLEKLASGEDVPWSMSCTVPFDICTECGNRAKNRSEYCEHARDHMTEVTKQGNQIGVVNDHMKYFDISRVRSPADRIAYGLLKAAGNHVVSGAELAEASSLFPPAGVLHHDIVDFLYPRQTEKLSMVAKLADIEKEIEACTDADSPFNALSMAFDPQVSSNVDDGDICRLRDVGNPFAVLGGMADCKVMLSLEDFLKLLLGSKASGIQPAISEAKSRLPGIFGRLAGQPCRLDDVGDFDIGGELLPKGIRDMISGMVPSMSLESEPVQRRMTVMVIRGGKPAVTITKSSAVVTPNTELAEKLATAYAMYKVAFCLRAGAGRRDLAELVVVHNYCGR